MTPEQKVELREKAERRGRRKVGAGDYAHEMPNWADILALLDETADLRARLQQAEYGLREVRLSRDHAEAIFIANHALVSSLPEEFATDQIKCNGNCIGDAGRILVEDLTCPVHGIAAQEQAQKDGWEYDEWMRAMRISYPFAPSKKPDQDPGPEVKEKNDEHHGGSSS